MREIYKIINRIIWGSTFIIMKPRELCEKAWQEIASKFPDFKVVSKGQKLKKLSQNKDLTFEIYFQANRNNYACSVEFVPHIFIYSTQILIKIR